jgi:hypothetical protein
VTGVQTCALPISTYYPSPYGSYVDLTATNNLYVGDTQEGDTGIGIGNYGALVYFSGAPDVAAAANNENTDIIWMGRYNVASDNSELRIGIGDNVTAVNNDRFVVGGSSFATGSGPTGSWYSKFVVTSNGYVGIGTNSVTTPSANLDIDGTVRIRTAGTPAQGRVLTATDANGNANWQYPVPRNCTNVATAPTAGTATATCAAGTFLLTGGGRCTAADGGNDPGGHLWLNQPAANGWQADCSAGTGRAVAIATCCSQ